MRTVLLITIALSAVACGDREKDQPAADQPPPNPVEEARLKLPPPPTDAVPGADTIQSKAVRVFIKNDTITLSTYQLAVGDVEFVLENTEDEQHILEMNWENGARWRTIPVGKGGRVTLKATLLPGLYVLFCPVPGHVKNDKGERTTFRAGAKPEPTGPVRLRIDTLPPHPPQPGPDPASRVR